MKRSTTPLRLAHAIANDYSADGIHGVFKLDGYYREQRKRAPIEWHSYQADFDDEHPIEGLPLLAGYFETWIKAYYHGLSIIRVRWVIENDEHEVVDDPDVTWRSLTYTRRTSATFGQVESKTKRALLAGSRSSDYVMIRGLRISVETGANYKNGRLYQT
jgi:hypothetical protein